MTKVTRQFTRAIFCTMLLNFATPCDWVFSAPQSTGENARENLGDDLLNDPALDELLNRAAPKRVDPAGPSSPLSPADLDELRRMLNPNKQRLPSEGEDLGQPSKPQSPLVGISQRMQLAEELIAAQTTTGETREVQDAIVEELDKLIDQLNEQCKKCSGGKASKPSPQQAQSSTSKPAQGKPSASEGSSSASTQSQVNSGGGGEAQPGDPSDAEIVKQLWGQLPERLRQQLLKSTADEFLPKYREDLEAYFRRLAEQEQSEP